jgi:hypothetical protein
MGVKPIEPKHSDTHTDITRDYAASASLIESIALDVQVHPKQEVGDLLYSLFLDDPTTTLNGHNLRFACGILADNEGQDKKQTLLEMNEEIRKLQTPDDSDLSVLQMWERLTYKTTPLPSVDSAVVQFPFTDGIASALVLNYKVSLYVETHKTLLFYVNYELTPVVSAQIIPGLRKYAAEHGDKGNVPIVMSTCSPSEGMCTHYAVRARCFVYRKCRIGMYSILTVFVFIGDSPWFRGGSFCLGNLIRTHTQRHSPLSRGLTGKLQGKD